MEFKAVSPKHKVQQAVKITPENILEVALQVNGTVHDGILTFKMNSTRIFGIAGDWMVSLGTDIHIYSDDYFQRNYESVDGVAEEW